MLRDKIREMIKLTGQAEMVDRLIPHLLDAFRRGYEDEGAKFTDVQDKAFSLLETALRSSAHEVIDAYVDLYAEHYTEEDVDLMIAFYGSSVGQKVVRLQPVILAASSKVSDAWAQRVVEKVKPEIERLLGDGNKG